MEVTPVDILPQARDSAIVPHASDVILSCPSNKVCSVAEGAITGASFSAMRTMDSATARVAGDGGEGSSLPPPYGGAAGEPHLEKMHHTTTSHQQKDADSNEATSSACISTQHPSLNEGLAPNSEHVHASRQKLRKNSHKDSDYSTYIDDVAMIVGGTAEHIQDLLVSATLKFQVETIGKRKRKLSVKSTIVANDLKLAHRIAKELATHDITILVAASHRDVGVEFNAATKKSTKLTEAMHLKAKKRTVEITRVARMISNARSLFITGAIPQAIW